MFASLNAASLSLPTVSLPTFSLPTIALPTIALPTIALPTIALPTIALPTVSLPTFSLPTISLPTIALPTISLPASTLLTRLLTPIINIGDSILSFLRAALSYPPMPLLCEFDAEDPEMGITLCAHHVTSHSSVLAMQDYESLEDEMEERERERERMRVRRGVYAVEADEKVVDAYGIGAWSGRQV